VADASVMPALPRGNPNLACMMIGEKAADLILGRTMAAENPLGSGTSEPAGR
jgi:choline dehydrogenase